MLARGIAQRPKGPRTFSYWKNNLVVVVVVDFFPQLKPIGVLSFWGLCWCVDIYNIYIYIS